MPPYCDDVATSDASGMPLRLYASKHGSLLLRLRPLLHVCLWHDFRYCKLRCLHRAQLRRLGLWQHLVDFFATQVKILMVVQWERQEQLRTFRGWQR